MKKDKQKVTFTTIKNGWLNFLESLQTNTKTLIISGILMLVIMGIVASGIFLVTIKGSEEVMVPDVVGKELTSALLDMQVKELYPKIQLRYSNSQDEKGCVLEQDPQAGAIVKAGRRVELVVSRGVVLDRVENYVGQTLDAVQLHLQALFTSSEKALLVLDDENILYEYNEAEAGTILEQDPLPDTNISEPIKLKLVVSRGPEHEKAKVPLLVGLTVNDSLLQMSRSKLVFDFTSRTAEGDEAPGTIISQLVDADTYVNTYSTVGAVFVFPEEREAEKIYGIFTEELPPYSFPLQVKLDALTPEGERFNVVTMMHPGGKITIPYILPLGTELILYIYDKEVIRKTVQ
ncbi:MAG: PASTA domain-containing protein [Treponemataceae bacterium]|nr:PASTA domain-containing protein [Spirochaetales bacterium]MDY6030431.1 PASTA domain-containing protein [Treponemataceae bacterium]